MTDSLFDILWRYTREHDAQFERNLSMRGINRDLVQCECRISGINHVGRGQSRLLRRAKNFAYADLVNHMIECRLLMSTADEPDNVGDQHDGCNQYTGNTLQQLDTSQPVIPLPDLSITDNAGHRDLDTRAHCETVTQQQGIAGSNSMYTDEMLFNAVLPYRSISNSSQDSEEVTLFSRDDIQWCESVDNHVGQYQESTVTPADSLCIDPSSSYISEESDDITVSDRIDYRSHDRIDDTLVSRNVTDFIPTNASSVEISCDVQITEPAKHEIHEAFANAGIYLSVPQGGTKEDPVELLPLLRHAPYSQGESLSRNVINWINPRERFGLNSEYMQESFNQNKQRSAAEDQVETRSEIIKAINQNSFVVIQGDITSIQVAQCILSEPNNSEVPCSIVISRKAETQQCDTTMLCFLAHCCNAVCTAENFVRVKGEELGVSIGYDTQLLGSVSPITSQSVLCTSAAALVKRLDSGLQASHIIVDDFYHRSAQTDLLLVILRDMIAKIPELRVILLSSAGNTNKLEQYFRSGVTLTIHGNPQNIDEYFLEDIIQTIDFKPSRRHGTAPNVSEVDEKDIKELNCNTMVSDQYTNKTRQTLCNMSESRISFELIEELIRYLKKTNRNNFNVLIIMPDMYNSVILSEHLSKLGKKQYKVYTIHESSTSDERCSIHEPCPSHVTKIIVTSSICENAVELKSTNCVIDCCRTKETKGKSSLMHTTTAWCSKEELDIRKSRPGLSNNRLHFYLITKERYIRLKRNVTPEVQHDCSKLCLAVMHLNLGLVDDVLSDVIDPPELSSVHETMRNLYDLGAVNNCDEITALGKLLFKLPVDLDLAKMIVLSTLLGCTYEVCVLVASVALEFPVVSAVRSQSNQKRAIGDLNSDHLTFVKILYEWNQARAMSEQREREYLMINRLNKNSLLLSDRAARELTSVLIKHGFNNEIIKPNYNYSNSDSSLSMIRAVLTLGLYPKCGWIDETGALHTQFGTVHNQRFTSESFHNRFMIFSEKSNESLTICSQTTPLLLIMSEIKSIKYDGDFLQLNNWLKLKVDLNTALGCVALRKKIEETLLILCAVPHRQLSVCKNFTSLYRCLLSVSYVNRYSQAHTVWSGSNNTSLTSSQRPCILSTDRRTDSLGHVDIASRRLVKTPSRNLLHRAIHRGRTDRRRDIYSRVHGRVSFGRRLSGHTRRSSDKTSSSMSSLTSVTSLESLISLNIPK